MQAESANPRFTWQQDVTPPGGWASPPPVKVVLSTRRGQGDCRPNAMGQQPWWGMRPQRSGPRFRFPASPQGESFLTVARWPPSAPRTTRTTSSGTTPPRGTWAPRAKSMSVAFLIGSVVAAVQPEWMSASTPSPRSRGWDLAPAGFGEPNMVYRTPNSPGSRTRYVYFPRLVSQSTAPVQPRGRPPDRQGASAAMGRVPLRADLVLYCARSVDPMPRDVRSSPAAVIARAFGQRRAHCLLSPGH